ncbi:MAG: hypothetical protein AB8B56_20305 [Crocinitomicaceae bacterium]
MKTRSFVIFLSLLIWFPTEAQTSSEQSAAVLTIEFRSKLDQLRAKLNYADIKRILGKPLEIEHSTDKGGALTLYSWDMHYDHSTICMTKLLGKYSSAPKIEATDFSHLIVRGEIIYVSGFEVIPRKTSREKIEQLLETSKTYIDGDTISVLVNGNAYRFIFNQKGILEELVVDYY